MTATSYGLGAVVAQALDSGCRDVVIGVGGSASTDGGAGFLAALGAVGFDASGARLAPGGRAIGECAHLDLTGLRPEIADAVFTIAADVDNPLYGPLGAASVYAPQRGPVQARSRSSTRRSGRGRHSSGPCDPHRCARGARSGRRRRHRFRCAIRAGRAPASRHRPHPRPDRSRRPAGGRACRDHRRGLVGSTVVAGRGSLGVSRRASAHGVPTYAVAGVSSLTSVEAFEAGLVGVRALSDVEPDRLRCIEQAADLLVVATEQLMRASLGSVALGQR